MIPLSLLTESFECGEGPVQFALHLHLEGKFGGANIPFAGFASPEGCLDFELFFRLTFGMGATGGYGHPFVVPPVQPAGHQVTPPTAPPAVPGHPFVIPPFQPAARQAATQQAPASQAAKPKLTASAPPAVQAEQIRRIIPHEDMDDGNKCDDEEETYLGLCYTKCSVLTKGRYPYRNTAFSCCEEKKCGLNIFKMKSASFLPCNGYDVSNANGGDGEASCPHAPGVCLKDEEQFGGLCYEKCSILKPDHPNRVGPESCCKTNGVACLNPFNDVTLPSLGVGGGKGDHNEDTPHGVHGPLVALTEGKK